VSLRVDSFANYCRPIVRADGSASSVQRLRCVASCRLMYVVAANNKRFGLILRVCGTTADGRWFGKLFTETNEQKFSLGGVQS